MENTFIFLNPDYPKMEQIGDHVKVATENMSFKIPFISSGEKNLLNANRSKLTCCRLGPKLFWPDFKVAIIIFRMRTKTEWQVLI